MPSYIGGLIIHPSHDTLLRDEATPYKEPCWLEKIRGLVEGGGHTLQGTLSISQVGELVEGGYHHVTRDLAIARVGGLFQAAHQEAPQVGASHEESSR